MHNTGAWRNDFEVVESGLTPAKELVSLTISLVLKFNVLFESLRAPGNVNDDRVVNYHFRWSKRIDALRISAQSCDCFAHGC